MICLRCILSFLLQIVKPITPTPGPSTDNLTTPGWVPYVTLGPATEKANQNLSSDPLPLACQHVVTTYVVPSILHFVAYMMGLIHFRVQENEHLYALMESVSIKIVTKYQNSHQVSKWSPCIKIVAKYQNGRHVSKWLPCIIIVTKYQNSHQVSK